MIVQTVSLKDPNENYLSCKSNGNLRFDLVDLDPSCIFFMVPMGAGRTCLKGPNGKFIDLHNASFRCDGVTTGAALIFDDKILKLDSGRYLSNVVVDETIAVSSDATKLEIKATSFESFNVNMSLSVPTVTYNSNVLIENRYRPGKNYLALENSSGTIDISFSIPYSMDGERNGTVEVIFNHMRDNNSGGVIDVELNDQPVSQSYAPPTSFEVESIYTSTLSSLSEENRLSITLSQGVSGTYCFSDAALVFRDQDGYLKQQNSMYALGLSSGSSYNDGKLEKGLREGNPYLTLEGGSSWSKITFTVREELLGIGNCVIKIQNRRELDTSIDVYLNGNKIEDRYDNIPTDSFGTSTLAIHSNQLERSNELVIKPVDGKYYISDVSVDVVSILPDVTEESFGSYIKEWILLQRPNIGQLHKIPRDDFPAWKFVSEAPYWFFLPFLPVSPQEISVLFDYYNMLFVSVAFEVRDYNNKARDFHRELLSTDIPRKNALRHAYWTAMLSRRWGLYFALDLSTAHEEAHVDLTIEGPFDHVTDKINNAVGSLLGSRTSTDL
ncbi:fascin domain-containing protein [Aspergillus luchuensis]|uniref:Uncharacterized protein n=1 Tax=Aspergillus kawachii TaxID=1069201 RepID=A0A146F011_ASPKA|nr:uncharacterized protein AKAW2_11975S [Aspergillus luchuensis]BCR94929.1 hypothetical protein AKAW2_11975S [Aspergillus luchuensis]GAT19565.1 hypothetical protein RIB2604_00601440 [Aspergillus luchuensis]